MLSLQIRIVCASLLLTTVFFITGCFSSNPRDIEAFLKPYQTDVTAEKYILQPPDEVEVHCARIPELNLQRMRIRPDGKLSFEILGEFQAAGKTPEEVADDYQAESFNALYTRRRPTHRSSRHRLQKQGVLCSRPGLSARGQTLYWSRQRDVGHFRCTAQPDGMAGKNPGNKTFSG